ncbi:MAG: hypothetical protein LBE56_12395 [Tannerella sp.]|jgi:hypothetical protein|nr:hypothetical protein [Tannerella sp.]
MAVTVDKKFRDFYLMHQDTIDEVARKYNLTVDIVLGIVFAYFENIKWYMSKLPDFRTITEEEFENLKVMEKGKPKYIYYHLPHLGTLRITWNRLDFIRRNNVHDVNRKQFQQKMLAKRLKMEKLEKLQATGKYDKMDVVFGKRSKFYKEGK